LWIAGGYLAVGLLWVFATDQLLLSVVADPASVAFWQSAKGWGFVVATSIALYLLLRERFRAVDDWRAKKEQGVLPYQLLFDRNPLPMWLYESESLRFVAVNDAALRLYGYTREEFLSMTVRELRPPGYIPRGIAVAQSRYDPLSQPWQWQHLKKDGSVIDVEITTADVPYLGLPAHLALVRDVTRERQAEARLRDSEAHFRDLFENAPISLWQEDLSQVKAEIDHLAAQGVNDLGAHWRDHPAELQRMAERVQVVDVNQATLRLFGVPDKKALLGGLAKLLPTEAYPVLRDQILAVANGETHFSAESVVLDARGNRIDVLVHWSLAPEAPRDYSRLLIALTDLTERKRATEALKLSEERFRTVSRATSDAVWDYDVATRTMWWNEGVTILFGYPAEEVGREFEWWAQRIHPEERARIVAGNEALMTGTDNSWQGEYRFRRRDGSYADVFDRGFVMRDGSGRAVRIVGALMDISERKRIERALRDSQERLDLALAASDLASWEWNIGTGEVQLSSHFSHMLGYQAGEIGNRVEAWAALTHPEDLPRVQAQLVRHFKGETLMHEAEYRMRTKSGQWRWMQTVGRVVEQDASGRAVRMSGTHRDVTAYKRTTDLVRKLSLAVEQSANMVVITDPEGVIEYVNPKFCKTTGYGREEILGRELWTLKSLDMPATTFRQIQDTLKSGGEWHGELHNRKRNGEFYWCLESISPVRDEHGSITNFVSVAEDISERKHAETTIRHLAYYDPLTGLPNRRLFRDRLEQTRTAAQRNGNLFGLMYLDLDRFKNVNDTLGHEIGDMLLKAAAQRISDCLRKGDTMARLGGDEFGVIVAEARRQEDLVKVAEKIIRSLQTPFLLNGFELFTSTSIGISVFPTDATDLDTLVKNADIALYRAKEQGRNNFQFFIAEMTARSMERLVMENRLRHAASRGELALFFQPQVSLSTGRATGAEALLRWRSPELGLLQPAEFVPMAEDTGLIVPIGDWVFQAAFEQLRQWRDAGVALQRVAVNLSPRQFRQPGLNERIEAAIRGAGIDPSVVELEITENTAMSNPELTQTLLEKLRRIGVQIAIDDFGTGYSSLATLKHFPVTRLKIDKAFVHHIVDDPGDAAIVLAIIRMAHSLKLPVVAEGVESESQLGFLQSHGCDEAQGNLFSQPLPAEEVARWLRSQASVVQSPISTTRH
jgi:diguanylate cyclase (GGDEF)-like protein/PAS domain S-box-containing protein